MKQNSTGTYEHFLVTIYNRYNETVNFVNASIFIGIIHFADQSSENNLSSLFETGPEHTTVLTFVVDLQISGAFYAKPTTTVDYAPFDVIIYIAQYGRVEQFWLLPELSAFPRTAPKC